MRLDEEFEPIMQWQLAIELCVTLLLILTTLESCRAGESGVGVGGKGANFGNAKSFNPDDPILSPPPDFQTFRRLSLVGSSSSFQCSGQLVQIVYVLHTTLLAAQCISFQIQPDDKKYVYCWCFNIKIRLNVIICNEVVMTFVLTTYFKE